MKAAARILKPPTAALKREPVKAFGQALNRFTVDQYHRIIKSGIFEEDTRLELIHGYLVEKPMHNPPHSKATRKVMRRLTTLFPDPEWVVGVQDSITLIDSEPEPDFFATHGPEDRYVGRHPGPKDVVLVVEISDTSQAQDRQTKLRLYAESKIARYCFVDVNLRQVEVHTQPRGGRSPAYRKCETYKPGDVLPVVVDGKTLGEVAVKDFLP